MSLRSDINTIDNKAQRLVLFLDKISNEINKKSIDKRRIIRLLETLYEEASDILYTIRN